ncbi:hypothetical protein AVEN_88619-1 [Araneus ventricosus]|uniref:Uncharacterized protein n=1 Tax=Araneus ventricosus TaxID=182803 RepID=A0A4Y2FTR0_ARAVE|nr:hypothetical protein AVEN_88619-1 [Araneus ventricosus]
MRCQGICQTTRLKNGATGRNSRPQSSTHLERLEVFKSHAREQILSSPHSSGFRGKLENIFYKKFAFTTIADVVVARRRQSIRSLMRCQEICQATRLRNGATGRNSTDHSPQVRTSSDSRFYQVTCHGNKSYLVLIRVVSEES